MPSSSSARSQSDVAASPTVWERSLADIRHTIESVAHDPDRLRRPDVGPGGGEGIIFAEHLGDGIHPDDEGHKRIAATVGKALTQATLAGAGATVVMRRHRTVHGGGRRGGHHRATGARARAVTLDVSDRSEVDALAAAGGRRATVASTSGATSPASWSSGPFLDAPEEDLDRILAVNLKGVLFGCQAGRPGDGRPARGWAASSTWPPSAAADTPSPNIVSYAICKAGVVQMTKSLAVEVGRKGASG